MKSPAHIFTALRSALTVALAVVCAGTALGQGDSIEVREMKAALEMSQQQLAQAESQRKAAVEGLAEAVRVSEEQMLEAQETKLKLQAFGVDLFTREEDSIEQRLLKAVRDLDISQQESERREQALHELSEAFLKYLQATDEAPEAEREAAQKAINQASAAMATPVERVASGDISDSKVVSFDSGIGLVVFDAGRQEGIRVGTPIVVLRGEKPIYSAMIVDVRESISGALLQEKVADISDVAVGDGIRLLPNQLTL